MIFNHKDHEVLLEISSIFTLVSWILDQECLEKIRVFMVLQLQHFSLFVKVRWSFTSLVLVFRNDLSLVLQVLLVVLILVKKEVVD